MDGFEVMPMDEAAKIRRPLCNRNRLLTVLSDEEGISRSMKDGAILC